MWKRAILLSVGWLLAAAATTAVGLAAIDRLGAGLIGQTGDDAPMTEADVQRRLAGEPAAAPVISPPVTGEATGSPSPRPARPSAPDHHAATSTRPSPSPTSDGSVTRTLPVQGGTVQARCGDDGRATLIAWSPAPGFRVDDSTRGPAASLSITFTHESESVRTVITCVDGEPTARTVHHDD